MNINQAIAQKVLETVDAGLVEGPGEPVPGQMCVEAAVCYAMGLAHSDNPPCVGKAVRSFKIQLNDSCWSTNAVRAAGMRKLAIAQLGSDEINQQEFAKRVAEQTIKILIPELFKTLAPSLPKSERNILEAADRCEEEGTAYAATRAADAAYAAADDAYAAVRAANAAVADADRVAGVAKDAARTVDAAYAAAGDAADRVAGAAYAAAGAAAYAAAGAAARAVDAACDVAAVARAAARAVDAFLNLSADKFLILSADIALQVLIDMKSPGCEFLHLCN